MKQLLYIGNKLSHKSKTPTSIETLGKLLTDEGFTVKTASSKSNRVLRLLDMLYSVIKYKKKTDFVLIDTYSTSNFYYAFFVSQLCRFLKLKYIPILRGGNLPDRLKRSQKLSKSIFNNAYKNIAPSKYTQHSFESSGYKNIMCIPNSIELKKYSFQKKEFNNANLLWVRSFSEIYNPTLAVKLLKALQDESISASLCMVGPENDGSMRKTKACAKQLNVEVTFTGKLTKNEWISLSENFNIFINTTNFDNMPVSVIEAMALGLPIISTNVGGIPFLINNEVDGVLVKPNDIDGFVNAILEIRRKPEKAIKMATLARKKAEEFNWTNVKKQWIKLLE